MVEIMASNFEKEVETLEQVRKYPGMGQPLTSSEFFQCMWGRYRRDDLHQEVDIRHQHGEMGKVAIRIDDNRGEWDIHSPAVNSSNVYGVILTETTYTRKRISNAGMGRWATSLSGSTSS